VFTTVNKNGKKKRGNKKRIVKISKYHVISAEDMTKIGILFHHVRSKRMIEQNSTGERRAEKYRTEQNRAEQGGAEHYSVEQRKIEGSRTEEYTTEQNKTKSVYNNKTRCDGYHGHS
jgi:hypothetical protein